MFLFIYLFFKALLLVSKWPKYVAFLESQSLNCPGSSKPCNVAGVEALLEEVICQKKKKNMIPVTMNESNLPDYKISIQDYYVDLGLMLIIHMG